MSPARLVIGNLDFESRLARARRVARGDTDDPRLALPPAVLDGISCAATLLRVFASDHSTLWTPRPVDPRRIARVTGLAHPRFVSGDPAAHASSPIVAWGEDDRVAELRRRAASDATRIEHAPAPSSPHAAPATGTDTGTGTGTSTGTGTGDPRELTPALTALSPRDPDAALAVNDRAFCLEAARELGLALAGSRIVQDVAGLERHLVDGGARAGDGGRWVVKATLSAAGRARLIGAGPRLDELEARRAARLFEVHGPLLFEPWMERVDDFGVATIVAPHAVRVLGIHRVEVDARGGFRAIVVPPGERGDDVSTADSETLITTARAAGDRARRAGYLGPLGIDAWRYRDTDGATRLHPLGEINARMSFGLLARALRDTLTPDARTDVRLRFGSAAAHLSRRSIVLVAPDDDGRGGAFLETLENDSR